ncbi:sensor histidine kinase [Nocardioides xinjiangensis]|nr:HAMP domain-containing sensor histidine kinase [Nocardioides sp. SYSU D00778]
MRDRLLALLVGGTVAVIALYGVPRAYVLADLVEHQQEHEMQRVVDTMAAVLAVQEERDLPVARSSLEQALGEAESIVHVAADGTTTRAGDSFEPDDSDLVVTASVDGGGRLTLTRSGTVVEEGVADAIMPLVLLGVALLAASAVAALFLARRLSRPFQELAGVATALGQGRFHQDVPHYAVPEAEAIGTALRRSAAQLDALVQREREFAVNASHELLTPITGLNLQLEDLRHWPETAPAVAEELATALETIDRLGSTIQELLAQDRDTRRTGTLDVDLAALVRHVIADWRQTETGQRREVRFESSGTVPARVAPEELTELLEMLLDHAARHTPGVIVVDCAELDTHLRVRVGDADQPTAGSAATHRQLQGALPAGDDVEQGLEKAAELAEALGGYLVRDESGSSRFLLMLPRTAASAG